MSRFLTISTWNLSFVSTSHESGFQRWWQERKRLSDIGWAFLVAALTLYRAVTDRQLYTHRNGIGLHIIFVASRVCTLIAAWCCTPGTYGRVRPAVMRLHRLVRFMLQVFYAACFTQYNCKALKLHFLAVTCSPLFYTLNFPQSLLEHLLYSTPGVLAALVVINMSDGFCDQLAAGAACQAPLGPAVCSTDEQAVICSSIVRFMDRVSNVVGAFSLSMPDMPCQLHAAARCRIFMTMWTAVVNLCLCNFAAATIDWRWRQLYAKATGNTILAAPCATSPPPAQMPQPQQTSFLRCNSAGHGAVQTQHAVAARMESSQMTEAEPAAWPDAASTSMAHARVPQESVPQESLQQESDRYSATGGATQIGHPPVALHTMQVTDNVKQIFTPDWHWLEEWVPPVNTWVYCLPLMCVVLATCSYLVYL